MNEDYYPAWYPDDSHEGFQQWDERGYACDYCGEENDESCPLVENIKGDIVCECCIGNGRDQTND